MENTTKNATAERTDFKIKKVNPSEDFDFDTARDYDVLIIEHMHECMTMGFIKNIWAHSSREVYLTPLIIKKGTSWLNDNIAQFADGVIEEFNGREGMDSGGPFNKPLSNLRIREILGRIQRIRHDENATMSSDERRLKKLFEYMYTRNVDGIGPVPFLSSKLGYSYPMLSANLDDNKEEKVIGLLDHAVLKGFLNARFYDTIYMCNKCMNAQLHYRETCPKCKSSHLELEDLVHHFSCAYVGPMSDFQNPRNPQDKTCPKCDRTLTHIGVDYDKPGALYTCKSCSHQFQDPYVKARCNNCGNDSKVEYLIKGDLFSFRLTKHGEGIAFGTADFEKGEVDRVDFSTNETYFLRAVIKEIERIKHNDYDCCIGALRIPELSSLYSEVGFLKGGKLQAEVQEIIQNELPFYTEIYFHDPMTVWFLIPENTQERAEQLLRRTTERIKNLLNDNFDGFVPEVVYLAQKLSKSTSARAQLEWLSDQVQLAR